MAGTASFIIRDLPRRMKDPDFTWEPYLPGIDIHRFYGDDRGGPSAILLRYAPGAAAPDHYHPGYEHIYVLSGEQQDERGVYGPGSFVVNAPGSRHSVRSPAGCVVLVVKEQPVVFVAGGER
jgi:anti-sigma factor ChrR (cupin superfamily)